jgi:hypothetical protein
MHLGSLWDSIKDALGDLGLDPNIARAVAQAYAMPSVDNINAVIGAYHARGANPPPELLRSLYERLQSTYPYPYGYGSTYYPTSYGPIGEFFPWIVGGIVLIMLLRR